MSWSGGGGWRRISVLAVFARARSAAKDAVNTRARLAKSQAWRVRAKMVWRALKRAPIAVTTRAIRGDLRDWVCRPRPVAARARPRRMPAKTEMVMAFWAE